MGLNHILIPIVPRLYSRNRSQLISMTRQGLILVDSLVQALPGTSILRPITIF